MADIVLFRPRYVDVDANEPKVPWGLLYISSYLLRAGYDVSIIDEVINPNWRRRALREFGKRPKLVGVTSMTGIQIKYGLNFSEFAKANSNAPVVWGGVHPSILPKQTLENKNIDFIVKGEGEEATVELMKAIDGRMDIGGIAGLGFKRTGEAVINPERAPISLDDVPSLPYHLIDIERYIHKRFEKSRVFDIITSRGCHHKCTFCYNQTFNKSGWRSLSVDKIFENLNSIIASYRIDGLMWLEDNFFLDKARVRKIAERIIQEGINISWGAQCRIDYIYSYDESFIRLLKQSGWYSANFGVESGSENILKAIKKDIAKEQVLEVQKKLTKNRIHQNYFFMMGFPQEADGDINETLKLIYDIARNHQYVDDIYGPSLYTPYPGTELYEESLKSGFQPPERLEGWIKMNWFELNLPWITKKRKDMLLKISWNIKGITRKFGLVVYKYFLFKLYLLLRFGINIPCFEKSVYYVCRKVLNMIRTCF